jgi:hypothetical protein
MSLTSEVEQQQDFAKRWELMKRTEDRNFWRKENIEIIQQLFPEYTITEEAVEEFYEKKAKNARLTSFLHRLATQFFYRHQ